MPRSANRNVGVDRHKANSEDNDGEVETVDSDT